jgi:hypothetical protein
MLCPPEVRTACGCATTSARKTIAIVGQVRRLGFLLKLEAGQAMPMSKICIGVRSQSRATGLPPMSPFLEAFMFVMDIPLLLKLFLS